MYNSSHNLDEQPPSRNPTIHQSSDSHMNGGQQANIGNNNNLTQDNSVTNIYIGYNRLNYQYLELKDSDFSKKLNFLSKFKNYLGVVFFLIITLFFWVFFGPLSGFPFPYIDAINLFFSCFNGKLISQVNASQKDFQNENFFSKPIDEINQLRFQADLYLGILERLSSNGGDCDDRLARTIEAIKSKREQIQCEAEPKQLEKYKQVIEKLEKALNFLHLDQSDNEFKSIEKKLDDTIRWTQTNQPSENVVDEVLNYLLEKSLSSENGKINPSRLGLIYQQSGQI